MLSDPYRLLRPLLFALDAETAHHLVLRTLAALGRFLPDRTPARRSTDDGLSTRLGPLVLPNPVGLAAGFDKDAVALAALAHLGFGFVEIGTVTPRPQSGNPRPRLFRLPAQRAIINRLGFNSAGADAVKRHLAHRPGGIVVGANIGPNRDTPGDRAWEDYAACLGALYPLVDYFTLNVSSPNTPGLRGLQEPERLDALLGRVKGAAGTLAAELSLPPRPLLLKLSPDLDPAGLEAAAALAIRHGITALVATNTTIQRPGLASEACPEGGLSGAPLSGLASEALRHLARVAEGKIAIVSVGGIMDPDEACARLGAGATAVQLYTGLVYEGPLLVSRILRRIAAERALHSQSSTPPASPASPASPA